MRNDCSEFLMFQAARAALAAAAASVAPIPSPRDRKVSEPSTLTEKQALSFVEASYLPGTGATDGPSRYANRT